MDSTHSATQETRPYYQTLHPLLTVGEAATLAGVSAESIRRWIKDRHIKTKVGSHGEVLVNQQSLTEFLQSHNPEERMLTIREVATRENVSENTVRRWIHNGELPGERLTQKEAMLTRQMSGSYQIRLADYKEFVLDHRHTVSAVARRMHRHPNTIRKWLREGRIPGYKRGKAWIVTDPFIRSLSPSSSPDSQDPEQETE